MSAPVTLPASESLAAELRLLAADLEGTARLPEWLVNALCAQLSPSLRVWRVYRERERDGAYVGFRCEPCRRAGRAVVFDALRDLLRHGRDNHQDAASGMALKAHRTALRAVK